MADHTPLRFQQPEPPAGPLHLRFGASDGLAPGDATVALHGRITGLRGHVGAAVLVQARLHGRITGLRGHVGAAWASNTDRPERVGHAGHWQPAQRAGTGTAASWRNAGRASAAHGARWQDAQRSATANAAAWQSTLRQLAGATDRWQDAVAQCAAYTDAYQQTLRHLAAVSGHWQQALQQGVGVGGAYQQTMRFAAPVGSRYQQAIASGTAARQRFGQRALHRHAAGVDHYQDARRPPPGISALPQPPAPPVCYDPTAALHLRFIELAHPAGPLHLRFACYKSGGVQPPTGTIIVPVRRVYIVINNTYLTRVSDGAPIPVHSMSLSLDAGSWTWGFDATLPGAAQAMVEPTAGGPVELAAFVNGTEFRVLAEEISSERVFLSKQIRVSGRGANARLDSPFAPQQIFTNTGMRTTEQLMGDVLTINGVPLGYSVDYRLTPWVVPAGGFVHLGTYISALTAIANAGGGYLRPHPSLQKFDVLHRYPTAPWEPVTPGIILPAAVTTRESITWVEKPDYNRVFVSGQDAGILGDVRRQGTAFDKAAPMVVDPLITDAAAAQQKGLEVLGNTGRQYEVGLRLPVLAQTGVIQPGVYVQYVDGAITRTGIVRSTQVEVGEIDVYQTIGVEVRG